MTPMKFVRKAFQKVKGHVVKKGHDEEGAGGDEELELLLHDLRGGYVHHNLKANTSLSAFLTGTTTALYVMPGWEVSWLYLKETGHGANPPRGAQMKPIHVGEFRYQLIGSKHDIKELLKLRKTQSVEGSRTTTSVGSAHAMYVPDPHDRNRLARTPQEEYFFGKPDASQTRAMKNTFLQLEIFEVPKPPSTLAREALLAMGGSFIGMGGETIDGLKKIYDVGDFIADALESLGGPDVKGKLNEVTGHGQPWVLDLSAVPERAEGCIPLPTTFGHILDRM